jgi:plasmid rolling circle replication initiator protein Rep
MTILQADTAEKQLLLSDRSPRDAKWDTHRGNAQSIGHHYDKAERFARLGERIAECSTALGFAERIDTDTGESRLKLRAATFCHVRHCPVCQWRRSLRNTARFFAAIPALQAKFPSHRWLFLTLTVRNCEPDQLRETIKGMNAGWKRLIERKDWPALGWAKATEITRNEADGSAHPHFHVMLMVPPSYFSGKGYVKQCEWAERWQHAMRLNYLPVVDVRAVKSKKEGQTLQAAIVETLKYATKAEDSIRDEEWLYTITEQLHKLRFIATGGALKSLLKDDMTNAEMIAGEDPAESTDAEPSMWFGWKPSTRHYVKR